MSQRVSGYVRRDDEDYSTIAWPVAALLTTIHGRIGRAWDPCDRSGDSELVRALRAMGIVAVGTGGDFLAVDTPPLDVTHLIANPPYGEARRGEMALAFAEHALGLVPHISMLLRADFDSAITRQHVFRHHPWFARKVVLLNRIKWFAGPSSPSDNHAWFTWSATHVGPPTISYVTREEAEQRLIVSR